MIKKCVFCNNDYEVTRGCVLKKRKYCSKVCHDNYWLKKGNKSGKFMGDKLAQGKTIKLTQTLSDFQKQFIVGTLLGDSNVGLSRKGSPNLRFQHTKKNFDYVLVKTEILKNFIILEKPTLYPPRESYLNGVIVKTKASYTSQTVTHQDLKQYDTLFYTRIKDKRTKVFNEKLINLITPVSLIFWYMDDGTLSKNHNFINLSTNCFSYKDHLKILRLFNEKFNLKPKIYFIKIQKNYYTRFNKEDVSKLMSLFEPLKQYIPPSMFYKFTFLSQPVVNPTHPQLIAVRL